MANWFQRVSLPDRFKGMSPAQIEEEFAKLESEKDALASASPPKVEETTEYKALQAQLAELEGRLNNQPAPIVQSPSSNEPPKRTSFLEDEDRAFAERANPIITQTFHNGSVMARQIARQELLETSDPLDKASNEYVLKNYGREIDQLYEGMPLQHRQDSGAFKNVVGVVKNRHFTDVIKSISTNNRSAFESAAGTGSSSGPGVVPSGPEKELSAGELRAARKLKISPTDYLKSKKLLRISQETGGYAEVKVD